jgi:putative protease
MVKKKKTVKKTKRAKPAARKVVKRAKAAKPRARKRAMKKPAVKRRIKKIKLSAPKPPESVLEKIGEVTHYFPHVNAAAVLLLKDGLRVGDKIYIKGHTTDFKETVESMQLDHVSIQEGKKAQEIGLQVRSRVRIGDGIYRI